MGNARKLIDADVLSDCRKILADKPQGMKSATLVNRIYDLHGHSLGIARLERLLRDQGEFTLTDNGSEHVWHLSVFSFDAISRRSKSTEEKESMTVRDLRNQMRRWQESLKQRLFYAKDVVGGIEDLHDEMRKFLENSKTSRS